MFRKTLTVIITAALLTAAAVNRPLAQVRREGQAEATLRQLQNGLQLRITGMKTIGGRTSPHALEVSWTITNHDAVRIEGYEITLELSGSGATGRVFQTPSPALTKVAVGLLSIPNETRAQLFSGPVTVTARLKARCLVGSKLHFTAEAQKTQTL